ncbi:putative TIGR00268 family protein [Hungatella hathewayi DSM 13479]|uniref:Putative TIGR00268 family protein n=1 Tax=Hungatella hathewayi DSM 13479 TaxID=566550 RepID=D3AAY2_9FIRM|nr:putative TIGR00268 family protein [Hungatella hathewayi DSM 13479]
MFQSLKDFAGKRNIRLILDGTNEDDMHVYRPGIQALKELGIVSPLAELHVTKAEVKAIAAEYGISVASRPSTPCMATRIPYNTDIDYEVLEKIGAGEAYLRTMIGGNVRLRLHGDIVRIEVDLNAFEKVLEMREELIRKLKEMGFLYITLDLEGFRSGSMDVRIS